MKTKIILADDHEIILDGLKQLLSSEEKIEIIDSATNGIELLDKVDKAEEIDLVILDINMPGMDGIEVTREIKERYPEVKTLVFSMYNKKEFINALIAVGVDGYILKNSGKQELVKAISQLQMGNSYFGDEVLATANVSEIEHRTEKDLTIVDLSSREKDVVRLICAEKSTAEIAEQLFVSVHTVNSHRKSILNKIDVKNAAGIFKYAIQSGIVKGFDLE